VEPKSPEVDCGWIEVGEIVSGHPGLAEVKSLRERPSLALAQKLFSAGSLWNSSAMVAHVCTFLELAWAAVPGLLQALESREVLSFPRGEIRIPAAVYEGIAPTDFSRQVLSSATDRLLSLRLSNVEWSDLEEESYRELVIHLQKTGELPSWSRLWPEPTTHIATATA
jgi:mannose-1-phosphate guanylyltransferase